jgi:ankyrin repeat protein
MFRGGRSHELPLLVATLFRFPWLLAVPVTCFAVASASLIAGDALGKLGLVVIAAASTAVASRSLVPLFMRWVIVLVGDLNRTGLDGLHPLYVSSRRGMLVTVKLLIDAGADVNQSAEPPIPFLSSWIPSFEGTSLYAASLGGHLEVVRLLLAARADVNRGARTPLHAAARKGHVKVLRLLIEKGADANADVKYHGTPLCEASAEGHLEAVKVLIGTKADVNKGVDRSPLAAAVARGHIDVVRLIDMARSMT